MAHHPSSERLQPGPFETSLAWILILIGLPVALMLLANVFAFRTWPLLDIDQWLAETLRSVLPESHWDAYGRVVGRLLTACLQLAPVAFAFWAYSRIRRRKCRVEDDRDSTRC